MQENIVNLVVVNEIAMTHTWRIRNGITDTATVQTGHDSYYFFQRVFSEVSEPISGYGFSVSFHETGELFDYLDFTQQDVSEMLEVDPSTLSRWRKEDKKLTKLLSKNILEMDQVIAKGVRIFGSQELFGRWLQTENLTLGNQKPATLMKNPYGVSQVGEVLESVSWGSVS